MGEGDCWHNKSTIVTLVSFPDLDHSPLALVLGMRLVYYHIRSHGLGLTYCEAVEMYI